MKKLSFALFWTTVITLFLRFLYIHNAKDPDLNLLITAMCWIIILVIIYWLTTLWDNFQSHHKKKRK